MTWGHVCEVTCVKSSVRAHACAMGTCVGHHAWVREHRSALEHACDGSTRVLSVAGMEVSTEPRENTCVTCEHVCEASHV